MTTDPAAPTRITDWDRPWLPMPLRLFNAVADWPTRNLVKLDLDSLLADARKKSGLDDFGDEQFLEPLRLLVGGDHELFESHQASRSLEHHDRVEAQAVFPGCPRPKRIGLERIEALGVRHARKPVVAELREIREWVVGGVIPAAPRHLGCAFG